MENSIQNEMLDHARTQRAYLTMYLMNGYRIVGKIEGFDDFTILVNSDGKQILVYKHAISTLAPSVPYSYGGN